MNQVVLKEAVHDEVFIMQKTFRVLLDGMSRPGKIYALGEHYFMNCPDGFNPYILSILKTLGDNNVLFCLCGFESNTFKKYIQINTGMECSDLSRADYAVVDGKVFVSCLELLNNGTLEFPENNATVIIETENLLGACTERDQLDCTQIALKGPGIKDTAILTIKGFDKRYIESIMEINSVFPLGIDIIFLDKAGRIACMPRTSVAEVV